MDALIKAGRIRLRPILMTTLCTLFCLLPLALGIGFFFFQAEDGIRDRDVTGAQTCALPISAEPSVAYPVCVAGVGACPPEDCGGAWGYEHLREVLADPSSEEHQDMLEWLGLDKATEFDPHRFDKDQANRALAAVSARRVRR